MAKVRLVKGPFAGRVMNVPNQTGQTTIRIVAPKPMSRKKKYEWQRQYIMTNLSSPHPSLLSKEMERNPAYPRVEAEYKIVMMPHYGQAGIHVVACMHPDGSLFYEYVPNSKKEY